MTTRNQKLRQSGSAWRRLMPVAALAAPFALVGCLADDVDVEDFDPGDPGALYSIGGEVAGVEPGGVVLSLGDETLEVDADGEYEFETRLGGGDAYEVVIEEQPEDRTCGLANASGEMPEVDLTDVHLHCTMVSAAPDIMQMQLEWSGPETANIKYSSDPDCDWSNYSNCADGGQISGASGNAETVVAVEEELPPDVPTYFVVETDAVTSEVVGSRAAAPGFLLGSAEAFATSEDHLFAGGDFWGLGIAASGGMTTEAETGELTGPLPPVVFEGDQAIVWAVEPDGEGGWYIGGQFTHVGSEPRAGLARIRPDGSVDPDWDPGTDGIVVDLKLVDNRIYVAGTHGTIDGFSQAGLAALDPETGEFDPGFTPQLSGGDEGVITMTLDGDQLFVGGNFDEVDGVDDLENIFVYDLAEDEVDANWTPEADGTVWDLELHGDRLYIGGEFDEVDEVTVNHLAALHAHTGNLVGTWDAGVNDPVFALEVHDGLVYVGGFFTQDDDANERMGAAAFDADTGALDNTWAPDMLDTSSDPEVVWTLVYRDGQIYAGGEFIVIDEDYLRFGQARLDPETADVDEDWRPTAVEWDSVEPGIVEMSFSEDGELYTGGVFSSVLMDQPIGIAAFDRETGVPDREWVGVSDLSVSSLEVSGDRLYVGGNFNEVSDQDFDLFEEQSADLSGGVDREGLAAFELDTGEVDIEWDSGGVNKANALASDDTHLYAGLNDSDFDHLASFELDTGAEDTGWEAEVNARVFDVAIDDDTLYAGGVFSESGEVFRERLAAFDLATGELDDDWEPAANFRVRAVTADDGHVFVGGEFTVINGDERDHIAALDGSSGEVDQAWDPGANEVVWALDLADALYVAGDFEELDGATHERIAAIDPDTGSVDAGWDAALNAGDLGSDRAVAVHADNDRVQVGGPFNLANDGEIRLGLVTFDAEAGELAWSDPFGMPTYELPEHDQQELDGTKPELPGLLLDERILDRERSEAADKADVLKRIFD